MRIDIISAVPEVFGNFFAKSIVGRAVEKGLAEIYVHNLRDYSVNKQKQVDDYPFGGGSGMVLMIEPIDRCIQEIPRKVKSEVIFLSPDGQIFDQPMANRLSSSKDQIIMLCGHYKGVDERVREHLVDREISMGDFVLSGGELPAAMITDAVIRLLPGVLGDETSALTDSFQDGLVAPPVYTRPSDYKGWTVPDILLSGHQKKIDDWKEEKAIERTRKRRPKNL